MRKAFANAVIARGHESDLFFLTGDLGFMALEGVRETLGDRFINCGVAEQNMVSVAAGLAQEGFRVFVYSIAPFCYARPFEQIRNDLCFGGHHVCLVGNGGGYAYGHMGPTHHALEDCAAMSALGLHVLAPTFEDDIAPMLLRFSGPTYLRLGHDARPKGAKAPPYSPWRQLLAGGGGVLAALGPLASLAWRVIEPLSEATRPSVWAVTELPLSSIPESVGTAIHSGLPLVVLEEHVSQGGLGMQLLYNLTIKGINVQHFQHSYALGYPSGRYGSQAFHQGECGLDEVGITSILTSLQMI